MKVLFPVMDSGLEKEVNLKKGTGTYPIRSVWGSYGITPFEIERTSPVFHRSDFGQILASAFFLLFPRLLSSCSPRSLSLSFSEGPFCESTSVQHDFDVGLIAVVVDLVSRSNPFSGTL